jgi:hypothetical protein
MANSIRFAEQKVVAILDAWERVKTPQDPKWRKMYAEAAIAAALPCYDARGNDLGADGWRAWSL